MSSRNAPPRMAAFAGGTPAKKAIASATHVTLALTTWPLCMWPRTDVGSTSPGRQLPRVDEAHYDDGCNSSESGDGRERRRERRIGNPGQRPETMSCGMPVDSPRMPPLDAVATAMRYGSGLRSSERTTCSTIGAMTRQIASLTRKADKTPAKTVTMTNRTNGACA